MRLELRDLTTSETIFVPEEGLVFGRAGGDAQVALRDAGVSKRHARIWGEDGAWFIEDLGSSNGTHLADQRLTEPVELLPGDFFALSKQKFEVVQVVADSPGAKNAQKSAKGPVAKKPLTPPARSKAEPVTGGDEAAKLGVGDLFLAVPRAVAYYLATIPLLLVNPIGTVRKGITGQRQPPLGRIELVVYAIPPLGFAALLGSVAAGVVSAVRGTLDLGALFPFFSLLGALVGAIVAGLLWHPVVGWIVGKLKGTSDERSRTHFFLMAMTAAAVLAIPDAVARLLALAPVPFIGAVGVVLGLVASLETLLVFYSWLTHFEVVKWFRAVTLALGALMVLVASFAGVVALNTKTDGRASPVAGGPEAVAQPKPTPEEKAVVEDPPQPVVVAEGPETVETAARGSDKPEVAPEPVEPPTSGDEPRAAQVAAKGYGAWKARREVVEKRITEDPTLLTSVPGLLPLYRAYQEKVYGIQVRYQKASSKKPSEAAVNAHLMEGELYEKTQGEIEQLIENLNTR